MPPRILLITGGDPAGHPFGETAPLIHDILAEAFDLHEETNLDRIKQEGGLDGYDAVVLHGRFPWRDEQAELGFESYVHSGKGLVVVHIASNSFESSPRWRRLVGQVWEYGYPHPPFTSDHPPVGHISVNITDTTHPAVAKVEDFDLNDDERYERLLKAPDAEIHSLAMGTVNNKAEPVVWILTPKAVGHETGGRVFHVTLGHNRSTFENDSFKAMLISGVNWAAGNI